MRTRISSLATALTLGVLALAAPPVADVGDVGLAGYKYVPEPTATLERATDIVVDDAHGQVFVAQTDAGLLVTDPDGSPVETIGMPGRQQALALSEDGSALYLVAWTGYGPGSTSPSLLRVDTVSHEVTPVADGRFSGCPISQIADAAGLLWIATSCGSGDSNDFGYIDPADATAVKLRWPASGGASTVMRMLRLPGPTPRLAMSTWSGSTVVLDLEVGDTVSTTQAAYFGHSGPLAVSPDGSQVVVGAGPNVYRLSPDGLSVLEQLNRPDEATAVAVKDDGTIAVGYAGSPDIVVYRTSSSRPFRTYEFGSRSSLTSGISSHGLEWGESNLYGVVDARHLYAFTPRQAGHVWLELDRRRTRIGEQLPVTVGLTPGATARDVEIWSVDRFDVRHLLKKVTVPRSGELETTVLLKHNSHLEVTYDGDESYEPGFDLTPDIGVSAKVKSVMRSGHAVHGVRVHHLDEPAVIAAKVLPDHAGDCIVFDVEVLAGGHWHDAFAKCVRANDDSAAALGLRGARQITGLKFRVRGIFRGDRDNDSAHGQWHYFKFVR